MSDLAIISLRTVFLYVLILVVLRIMGKREVGELSLFDVVIFVIMAEVAALALDSPDVKLINSIVPILILLVIQVTSAFVSLKSKKFRDIVDGEPAVLIRDGHIVEDEMSKQRYNLDDLFQQLREQQVGSIREVNYAFLEPSGNLSVFTYDQTPPVLSLISDGELQSVHLELIGKTEQWLMEELKKQGINDVAHIFYCTFEDNHLQFQLKEDYR